MSNAPRIINVATLGEPARRSPLDRTSARGDGEAKFVSPQRYVRASVEVQLDAPEEEFWLEKAGAREQIYFDPAQTKAAIVTCGGLCPGLNNVIRSVFLELHMNYHAQEVWGVRYGYQGLNPAVGEPPVPLTMELVERIHEDGGTLLGSSRGGQDTGLMVDFLVQRQINILLCVGGDGTQRGTHQVYEELQRRGLPIAVVGIPKTIDNDLHFCSPTFGFATAVDVAARTIAAAHVEAKGAPYGIGLVKLMGREAGFIAAAATVASQEVNFCLVPEIPFALEGPQGLLETLRRRMLDRKHAVIVIAEGAGQNLFTEENRQRDASGNVKLQDIGLLLKQQIETYFKKYGPPVSLKYIDPSYLIRSVPANSQDDILCDQFGRRAVHAAMAGKTDLLIGYVNNAFVHVPLAMAIGRQRRMNPEGELWTAVRAATGQPRRFV